MSLWLHGIGHFHPENEISNAFLADLDIGTSDAWIVDRVGIRSRRTVLALDYVRTTRNRDVRAADDASTVSHAEMAAHAGRMALDRAGIAAGDVGMVIAGGSVPDSLTPAEATWAAAALDIEAPSLDINSACTSLHAQLSIVAAMRPELLPRFVLLVLVETVTKSVDYGDRSSAVLWGDGAAALVLSATERARAEVLGTRLDSSPQGAAKVRVPRHGHFVQDGQAVQGFAVRQTGAVFENLRAEHGDAARVLHFVGHQANLRMLRSVCERVGIEDPQHHANVEWFGNTASAGSPSVISERWEAWRPTDDVGVVGVGAGLTWGGFLLRFGEGG